MKDLIPRVEIVNQHLYNDPMIKMPCQKACKIKRAEDQELPHEISTAEWNDFCDEVDEALKPVDQAKRVARRSLIPSFILVLIIASLTIGSMLLSYDFKYRPYVTYTMLGILALHQLIAYCKARSLCKGAYAAVVQICSRHSSEEIKFEILMENKRHLRLKSSFVHKKYFIKVTSPNGNSGDVESAVSSSDMFPVRPLIVSVENSTSNNMVQESVEISPPFDTKKVAMAFSDVDIPLIPDETLRNEEIDDAPSVGKSNASDDARYI